MRTIKDPSVRKGELVETATALFLEQGYEKTTVESIITRAGVAKGCFYHYFRSKDEIFEECIAGLTRSILDVYERILTDERKSPKQRLLEYIDYNFRLVEQDRNSLHEAIHSDAFAQIHFRIMKESVKQVMPTFAGLIAQGQDNGDFRVKNAGFTAAALLGAFQELHGASNQGLAMDQGRQRELVIDLIERLLGTYYGEPGIRPGPGPDTP